MTAFRGIQRPSGPPTLEWLLQQTVEVICPVDGLAGPCRIWQRSKTPDGYGRLSINGRDVVAHRAAYEVAKGPVPCWLTMDHICRVRACISPDHVEPVTQAENTRRGEAPSAIAHREGKCKFGHELSAVGGRMRCKVCLSARQREWYERKRAPVTTLVERPPSNDATRRTA